MPKKINMINKKFNRLTVLSENIIKTKYDCVCDCGKKVTVLGSDIRSGHTKSCGCFNADRIKKHGFHNHRLYSILKSMKSRCYSQKNKNYKYYGGKGVFICEEWLNDKSKFFEWALKNGYRDDLTIDRINNNKEYSPENCKWSTPKEQNRNQSSTILININNEIKCLLDWSLFYKIHKNTVLARIKRGWPLNEDLFIIPPRKKGVNK